MQECIVEWWQSPLFITILPIIGSILGWIFKMYWERRKPYKLDQETFEKINQLFASDDNFFIDNMRVLVIGNPISKADMGTLHKIVDINFNQPLFFINKKVQKKFERLKKNTKLLSSAFIEAYEFNGNSFIMDKPYNKMSLYKTDLEYAKAKQIFNDRLDMLYAAQDRFINSYDDFVTSAKQRLYTSRLD